MTRLNPIIKRDIEVRSRGFTLPVIMTAVNVVLFTIGFLGSFGVVSEMRQTWIADYRPMLDIYMTVVLTEFVLILLICPVYTASAISGERETGTFDLLLTTRLTPANIVTEKLISACISVGAIIISCLPAMLLPLIFGGVSVQSAIGLMLLFLPEAFLVLSIGMLASSAGRSVVRSTVICYAVVVGLITIPVLLPVLTRPFMVEQGNRISYLIAADPLLPVFAAVTRQAGRPGAVRMLFSMMGLVPDDAFTEHIILISVMVQLALSFALILIAVINITPRRKSRKFAFDIKN
ncbi:MAG: hypothetical protein II482_02575 [Lachnospiraceae bacterium]|nr:hypothetical protein [Lachnospiraceae bacterium]